MLGVHELIEKFEVVFVEDDVFVGMLQGGRLIISRVQFPLTPTFILCNLIMSAARRNENSLRGKYCLKKVLRRCSAQRAQSAAAPLVPRRRNRRFKIEGDFHSCRKENDPPKWEVCAIADTSPPPPGARLCRRPLKLSGSKVSPFFSPLSRTPNWSPKGVQNPLSGEMKGLKKSFQK